MVANKVLNDDKVKLLQIIKYHRKYLVEPVQAILFEKSSKIDYTFI